MALGDKTITGEMPVLTVDLTSCERGAPCEFEREVPPGRKLIHTCRIHKIREFLKALGWVEDAPPPKAAA